MNRRPPLLVVNRPRLAFVVGSFSSFAIVLANLVAFAGCGGSEPSAERPQGASVTDADRDQVLAHIATERNERGLGRVDVIDDAPPLQEAAALLRGGATPERAIRTALERVAELESSDASGWCIPATSPSDVDLPSEILERKEVTLAVVAVRKPTGAVPPPFVVCILVLEDGSDFGGHGPAD